MKDLRYFHVPVFVRIHNMSLIDPEKEWQRSKLDKPNKLTSSVMYNVYHNQNMKRSISGMTKINFATMDLKSLGVMMPIIIGVIFAIFFIMKGL